MSFSDAKENRAKELLAELNRMIAEKDKMLERIASKKEEYQKFMFSNEEYFNEVNEFNRSHEEANGYSGLD